MTLSVVYYLLSEESSRSRAAASGSSSDSPPVRLCERLWLFSRKKPKRDMMGFRAESLNGLASETCGRRHNRASAESAREI